MPIRKAVLLGVNTLAAKFVGNVEHVRGRHHDDVGFEVADQLDLFFSLPTRHRNDRTAQFFGTVMRSEAAGKKAVAVGNMDDIAGSSPEA
jgi:hypothetical protein